MDAQHQVTIRYCTQCQWMLRAQWYAGELLQTFSEELTAGVTLIPGRGGIFRIDADGTTIWNRKSDGGFPDIVRLKRLVRDIIAPGKPLGHADAHQPQD